MRQKNSSVMGLVVFILGVIFVSAIVSYTALHSKEVHSYFKDEKNAKAMALCEKIATLDLTNDYPTSPSAVLAIYNKLFCLVYGNMIVERELLSDVVKVMRKFYSGDILEQNSVTDQLETVEQSLEGLQAKGVYCIGTAQEPIVYLDDEKTLCKVQVVVYLNELSQLKRCYYLQKDMQTDFWKISGWEMAKE